MQHPNGAHEKLRKRRRYRLKQARSTAFFDRTL